MFDPISLTILGISCLAGSMAANASYHQEKNPETKKKLGAAKDGLAVAGGCMAVGGAIANAYNQNKNLAQQLPSSSGTLSPSQQFWNTPIRQQVGPILQVPPSSPPVLVDLADAREKVFLLFRRNQPNFFRLHKPKAV